LSRQLQAAFLLATSEKLFECNLTQTCPWRVGPTTRASTEAPSGESSAARTAESNNFQAFFDVSNADTTFAAAAPASQNDISFSNW